MKKAKDMITLTNIPSGLFRVYVGTINSNNYIITVGEENGNSKKRKAKS